MGKRTHACRFSVEIPDEKKPLGIAGVDRRIILNWIIKKLDVGME
jgi:hypothetical protein